MFKMFEEFFKVIPLDGGFTLVEPSAGIIPQVFERLKLFDNAEGKTNATNWNTLFLMTALHKDGNPVLTNLYMEYTALLNDVSLNGTDIEGATISSIYFYTTPELFKEFMLKVSTSIPMDKLTEWYGKFDEAFLASKRAKDESKKDTSPEVTTGL